MAAVAPAGSNSRHHDRTSSGPTTRYRTLAGRTWDTASHGVPPGDDRRVTPSRSCERARRARAHIPPHAQQLAQTRRRTGAAASEDRPLVDRPGHPVDLLAEPRREVGREAEGADLRRRKGRCGAAGSRADVVVRSLPRCSHTIQCSRRPVNPVLTTPRRAPPRTTSTARRACRDSARRRAGWGRRARA